jgi:hypothetical protein
MTTSYPWQSQPSAKSGLIDEFSAFLNVKPGQAENLRKAALAYVNSPARSADPKLVDEASRITGIHNIRLTLFDNGTRLLFATSFDTDWEPYVLDSLKAMKGVAPWGQFLKYTVEAPNGIDIPGEISDSASLEFLNTHRTRAAAYDDTFKDLTVAVKQKAMALYKAFQQVLDNPAAAQALQHPALKPLLDQASD